MSKTTCLLLPIFGIVAGVTAAATPAFAEASPATPVASPAFSTSASDLGTLLDNPATRAIVVKYLPNIAANPQIAIARSLTLKQIQSYAPDRLPDDTLAKIDADLAQLPARN